MSKTEVTAKRRTKLDANFSQGLHMPTVTFTADSLLSTDRALKLAAVWACIRMRGEDFGAMDWTIIEPGNDLSKRIDDHPLAKLMERPNWVLGGFTLREMISRHVDGAGNFIGEIERARVTNAPLAIWPLDPDHVTVFIEPRQFRPIYRVRQPGQDQVWLPQDRVFHIKGPSENGYIGLSAIQYGASVISAGLAQQQAENAYFSSGMQAHHYWSIPDVLDEDIRVQIEESLNSTYASNTRQTKIPVVHGGVELKNITQDPATAKLIESKSTTVRDVCRLLRVPPHKIFSEASMTFDNMEHVNSDYAASFVPLAAKVAEEVKYKLLGGAADLRINLDSLIRADSKTRMDNAREAFHMGAITVGEVRHTYDPSLMTIENADDRYIQSSMAKLGDEPNTDAQAALTKSAAADIEGRQVGSMAKMLDKEDIVDRVARFIDKHHEYVARKVRVVCEARGVAYDDSIVQKYCLELGKTVIETRQIPTGGACKLLEEFQRV